MRILRAFIFLVSSSLLFSCSGGGGGSGDGDGGLPPPVPTTSVDGNAVDALIINGTVTIYAFNNGQKGDQLAQTTTDSRGFYEVEIQSSQARPILIEVTGGSYEEEASGVSVTLRDTHILRAVTQFEPNTNVRVMVTPWTNLATALMLQELENGENVTNAIARSNSAMSGLLDLDILSTFPANVTDPANANTILTDELKYGFFAAALSQLTYDISISNNITPHTSLTSIELAQLMYRDVNYEGLLDGYDGARIGIGSTAFSAHTFRRDLASAMVKVANDLDINKTTLTVDDLLPSIQSYADSTDNIWGGALPQSIDATGPTITTSIPPLSLLSGIFEIPFSVTDPLGLSRVEFFIDSSSVGVAASLENPSLSLDTSSYSDGQHTITVNAVDAIGNNSNQDFNFIFDNSAPTAIVTSPSVTNMLDYRIAGTVSDGAGGIELSANGISASISGDGTWFADIVLFSGSNTVEIVVSDQFGNNNNFNFIVSVDQIDPDNVPFYSQATFVSNLNNFLTDTLDGHDYNESQLYVDFASAGLNGIPVSASSLNVAGIPYIGVSVTDPVGSGVFTPDEDIIVDYQFTESGTTLVPYTLAPREPGSDNQYLVPLVTDYLSEQWLSVDRSDLTNLRFRITDNAGNETLFNYPFRSFIDIPAININGVFRTSDVEAFNFDAGSVGGLISSCRTDSNGRCSIPIETGSQFVLLRFNNGSYVELSTNSSIPVSETHSFLIYFDNTFRNVYLTPLSALETGIALKQYSDGLTLADSIQYASDVMSDIYLFDPINTPVAADLVDIAVTDDILHRLAIAGLSELSFDSGQDLTQWNTQTLITSMIDDYTSDGFFDGIGSTGVIDFGTRTLSANTYRNELAQYIYNYATDEGISDTLFPEVRTYLEAVSLSSNPAFNGIPPVSFDDEGPIVTNTTPSSLVNQTFTFTATVTDDHDVSAVTIYLDGDLIDTPTNLNSPSLNIDTTAYGDGLHTITVVAIDEFQNQSTNDFNFSFDNTAPTIQANPDADTWQSSIYRFNVNANDVNGIGNVVVTIDGSTVDTFVGTGFIDVDTSVYLDGAHSVEYQVSDTLGNSATYPFAINFDNTQPNAAVTSNLLVNAFNYVFSGTQSDAASGVSSISVNGNPATLNAGGWSYSVSLPGVINNYTIIVSDLAGNTRQFDVTVFLDNIPPSFGGFNFSDGRFPSATGTHDLLNLERIKTAASTQTLIYENDHISTGLSRSQWSAFNFEQLGQADDFEKIMYFYGDPSDPVGSGVFTQPENLIMEYRYLRNGSVIADWTPAVQQSPIPPSYIFPLTSDLLDSSFETVSPTDLNRLEIRLTDEAGNRSNYFVEFFADITVPQIPLNVQRATSSRLHNLPFNQRQTPYNTNQETSTTVFTNPSTRSILMKLDTTLAGGAEQIVDTAEREHLYSLESGTFWRVRTDTIVSRTEFFNIDGRTTPVSTTTCSAVQSWTETTSVEQCTNATCTGTTIHNISRATTNNLNLESDDLSLVASDPNWSQKNDLNIGFGSLLGNRTGNIISYDFTTTPKPGFPDTQQTTRIFYNISSSFGNGSCPPTGTPVVGWEEGIGDRPSSEPGYPRNNLGTDTIPVNLTQFSFTVEGNETVGGTITPDPNGWYLIQPEETVTITTFSQIPSLQFNNDSEVIDPGFNSYDPKRFDESITYSFDIDLTATFVIDNGTENVDLYTQQIQSDSSTQVYQTTR